MNLKGLTMNLKNKALIIGLGSIGKKHFIALKNLDFEVAFLSKSAKESGLEGRLYRSFDEVNLEDFSLFVIANITSFHLQTLQFIDTHTQGKTIMVEKPLFEKSYKFIPSGKNEIFVAYLLRFNPVVQKLKALIENEESYFASFECDSYLPLWRSGDYRQSYSAKKDLGGGVLLDLSHELDLALFLFGEARLLFGEAVQISELELESDDFAFLALRCGNLRLHIRMNYFSKFERRVVTIHTKKHSFRADLRKQTLELYSPSGEEKLSFQNDTLKNLEALHLAILRKDEDLCTLEDGQRLLKICDAVRGLK